jgi:hypothetical protein
MKLSAEHCAAIAKTRSHEPRTAEVRAKIAAGHLGKQKSPAHVAALQALWRNPVIRAEIIAKRAETKLNKAKNAARAAT